MEYNPEDCIRKFNLTYAKLENGVEGYVNNIVHLDDDSVIASIVGSNSRYEIPLALEVDPRSWKRDSFLYYPFESGYYKQNNGNYFLIVRKMVLSYSVGFSDRSYKIYNVSNGDLVGHIPLLRTLNLSKSPIDIKDTIKKGYGPLTHRLFLTRDYLYYLSSIIGLVKNKDIYLTSPTTSEYIKTLLGPGWKIRH